MVPTVHYNMGGIPTNWRGEVLNPKKGDPDAVVPGAIQCTVMYDTVLYCTVLYCACSVLSR